MRVRPAGDAVNIFVEDTGIGIPRTALPKLGRPFEQVETEFSRSHEGSGLGLAIARSLAELHGGALRIRSEDGVGTIVMVRLPREVAPARWRAPRSASGAEHAREDLAHPPAQLGHALDSAAALGRPATAARRFRMAGATAAGSNRPSTVRRCQCRRSVRSAMRSRRAPRVGGRQEPSRRPPRARAAVLQADE